MPITWITSLLGSLALIGTPFFSGFYSKDSIIEAVHESHLWGANFAYYAVLAGVFITAFYSFRMYFDAPVTATTVSAPRDVRTVLTINGALILILGIVPGGLMTLCAQAIIKTLGT